jgi:Lon protease-like protein
LVRYAEYGTMLEIRDRVLLKDGCSILSSVGGRRFRVLSGGERDGYDTAQVEFLRDTPIPADQLLNIVELHNKVRTKLPPSLIHANSLQLSAFHSFIVALCGS